MAEGLGEGFGDEMKAVSRDMNNAIPTDFDLDLNSSISGVSAIPQANGNAVDVTIPLTVDGVVLTKIISRIQWSQNAVTVRNMGATL